MTYLNHQGLLARAKDWPPQNPKNTVSSFSGWVFGLYVRSSRASMQQGKETEFAIEQQARFNRFTKQPNPISPEYELDFADPLDSSCKGFRISSLTLNGRPLFGIPDIVYREKTTGKILIVERKSTGSQPAAWPNLKVQLWCYGQIDKWKSAPKVQLVGAIYELAKYDLNHATQIGPWDRNDKSFDAECRQLFERFGGQIA